jgi:hypothetical protein
MTCAAGSSLRSMASIPIPFFVEYGRIAEPAMLQLGGWRAHPTGSYFGNTPNGEGVLGDH